MREPISVFAILRNLTRLKVLDLSRSDAITGDLASLRDVRRLHSLHLPDLQVTGTRAQVEDVRHTGRVLEFLCGLVRKKLIAGKLDFMQSLHYVRRKLQQAPLRAHRICLQFVEFYGLDFADHSGVPRQLVAKSWLCLRMIMPLSTYRC